MKLLDKKQSQLDENQNIFEKKKVSQTLPSVKDSFNNCLEFTPYYFKKSQPIKKFNAFVDIVKSNIQKLDSKYKLKQMISNSVSQSINHSKWEDINDYLSSGYPLTAYQILDIKTKIKEKDDYLSFSKQTSLHDIFLFHAFVNSTFQIYTKKSFEFLSQHFSSEIVPLSVIDNFNERSNYNNHKYQYKGVKLNDLGYNKDNIISALNIHNSLTNPFYSIPLFSCVLHRAINHDDYRYNSFDTSILQPLSFLAKYIEHHLSKDDKLFIYKAISNSLKNNFNSNKSELNTFFEEFKEQFNVENDKELVGKDFIQQKIKEIYSGHNQNLQPHHSIQYNNQIFSKEKLSKKFEQLVDSINILFIKIQNNENYLEDYQVDNINKLVNEIVPQSIEQYLDIDIENRQSLKNIQGKSADDLLLESLNNIKESLLPVINLIEEKKLEKLSISTRKLAI